MSNHFLTLGLDHLVLTQLQQLWESKLTATKVAHFSNPNAAIGGANLTAAGSFRLNQTDGAGDTLDASDNRNNSASQSTTRKSSNTLNAKSSAISQLDGEDDSDDSDNDPDENSLGSDLDDSDQDNDDEENDQVDHLILCQYEKVGFLLFGLFYRLRVLKINGSVCSRMESAISMDATFYFKR